MTIMTFEQHIMRIVARTEPEVSAHFVNGTLFYRCAENQSRRIFSNLMQDQAGRVQISMAGEEYAVDFVAEKPQQISTSEDFDYVYYAC